MRLFISVSVLTLAAGCVTEPPSLSVSARPTAVLPGNEVTISVEAVGAGATPGTGRVALTATAGSLGETTLTLASGRAQTTWTCGSNQAGCTAGTTADISATWNELSASTRVRLTAIVDAGPRDAGVDAGRVDSGTELPVSVGDVFLFGQVAGPTDPLFGVRSPDGGVRLGWTQNPGTPVFFRGRLLYSRGNEVFVWAETPVLRDGGMNLLPRFPEASHPSAASLLPCPASAVFQAPGGEVWARCGATLQKGGEQIAITAEDEVLGTGSSAVLVRRTGALFVATAAGRTAVTGVPAGREFGANARGRSAGFDLIAENTASKTCYRVAIDFDGGYAEEEQEHVPLFETGIQDQRGLQCTKGRLAPTGDLTYFPVTAPAAGLYIVATGSNRDAGTLVFGQRGYDLDRNPPVLNIDQTLESTFVVVSY